MQGSGQHCADNAGDRRLGAIWERAFCDLAAKAGRAVTPLQIEHKDGAALYYRFDGRAWHRYTLPDVAVWNHPGEYYEIKHKAATSGGLFGLEKYRFDALMDFAKLTRQGVYYAIHDHAMAGGRDSMTNEIAHWLVADVLVLDGRWKFASEMTSYVGGKSKRVPGYYWHRSLWRPLGELWAQLPT